MTGRFTRVQYDNGSLLGIGKSGVPIPFRVYEAMEADGQEIYWERTDKSRITLPQYIEGMARGTIARMYGHYYVKVTKCR